MSYSGVQRSTCKTQQHNRCVSAQKQCDSDNWHVCDGGRFAFSRQHTDSDWMRGTQPSASSNHLTDEAGAVIISASMKKSSTYARKLLLCVIIVTNIYSRMQNNKFDLQPAYAGTHTAHALAHKWEYMTKRGQWKLSVRVKLQWTKSINVVWNILIYCGK